ncbi:LLM class flavin-dependent oxidoreductase [Microbacterium sp. SORGH_AS_0862]|uniref:LLM class flavin-dependent oxidoreductase n=1 Tax=Microbacterium sp. SORGH_AS_0862 TaxID=3041789 RepID=UPI002790681E|nr:LLM class flavin-dependent oxidoreductase [Microbacterium sp. SORGH_AS_0862]MDQ1205718.1 alkanesulfonate monooxygenase SsuD/methylene tetrahydromethanopterin reductase-like flavin-dependent oxidoreductase (luciferase family) [Microbacterium sp. SORGH_AS_0862]
MSSERSSLPRIGFQTHVHGDAPARELLPGLVDLFVAADELGFSSGWLAQHHAGSDSGRLPSPLIVLAAAATATRTIRLGTTVIVLPLEDPLRLAEDAAVLDELSAGRLELGLGTGGFSAAEFAAFGQDPQRRRQTYAAKLERLEEILSGQGLPDGLTLTPSAPGLIDRIWEAASTPDRAARTAHAGRGLLLGIGDAATQRALADAYLAGLPEGTSARIAAFRGAFPGANRDERAAALWPDVARFISDPAVRERAAADPHAVLDALVVHYGTPPDVVASVRSDPSLPVATDYVFAVQSASTSIPDALRILETIAVEIRPALSSHLLANGAPA